MAQEKNTRSNDGYFMKIAGLILAAKANAVLNNRKLMFRRTSPAITIAFTFIL